MAFTRTEREKYLLSPLPSRKHILQAAYRVAARLPADSTLRPGMPATEMMQVILDREFPIAPETDPQDPNMLRSQRSVTNVTRKQRKRELTALGRENRRELHAAFIAAVGALPAAWLTDLEIVGEILRRDAPQ